MALLDLEPPPPQVSLDIDHLVHERWLDVPVNHFDASNTDTFPMRYYFNELYFGPHIIIVVGGEWEIHDSWVREGLAVDVARYCGAGVFYTEHRYYGHTRPTQDTRSSNLRYLTADQALGDLALFIQYIKSDEFEEGRFKEGKVVLVGCSYGGTLATWMKLAHPHLVDGVFSDSGPLQAQEDFPEYVEVIAEALRSQGSGECLASVDTAVGQLVAMFNTSAGPAAVSEMFNTCSIISANTPLDVATFFWFGIQETFAHLVQYATPGDIPAACDILTSNTTTDPVQRLANFVTAHPWMTSKQCLETRYSEVVAAHTNTSYEHPDSVMRLWWYQTCVQFGWYQTAGGRDQPFHDTVPLHYYHQLCRDLFGNDFDEHLLRYGIERTNTMFAGWSYLPDNVASVVGSHDPWSPVGPRERDATGLAPVYVVPRASHCRALGALNSTVSEPELQTTKLAVANHLSYWLTETWMIPIAGAGTNKLALALLLVGLVSTVLL